MAVQAVHDLCGGLPDTGSICLPGQDTPVSGVTLPYGGSAHDSRHAVRQHGLHVLHAHPQR